MPDDPTLQVKMAHAMRTQEMETRRCFTCNKPGHLQKDHWKYEDKKWDQAPTAEGASPKQVSSRVGEAKTLSARSNDISSKPSKVKRAPYLNPDAFYRFIGPKNWGKTLIDDELITCLLDNGAQLNFITPAIVMDDPDMSECRVILGTPTIYRVMEVIKESEISKLAVPWASS